MDLTPQQFKTMGLAGGLGAGVGGLAMLLGGNDPSKAANKYLNQIPGTLQQYFSPYINAGIGMLPGLQEQYGSLMNDPGARLNQIGAGYQQSPGFKFALDQALGGANRAAAAGGMAGSPAAQQQAMQVATGLANQDYNSWLQNAMGLYGTGLQGGQGLYNTGAQAGMGLGQDLASVMAQKAGYAAAGQAGRNEGMSNMFGGIASALPFMF